MARQKKIKVVQEEEKKEVIMTEVAVQNELEMLQNELDLARIELEKTRREIEAKKEEFKYMSLPTRELSSDEKVIVDKHLNMSVDKKAAAAKIEAQKAYDNVKITGRFMNRRAPGQTVKLTYMKYEGDPVKWYSFEDGKVYTIPRGFADQINEYYHKPRFIQKEGPQDPNQPQSQIHEVDTSNKIYAFVPVNF